jgi:hypothetical protein
LYSRKGGAGIAIKVSVDASGSDEQVCGKGETLRQDDSWLALPLQLKGGETHEGDLLQNIPLEDWNF